MTNLTRFWKTGPADLPAIDDAAPRSPVWALRLPRGWPDSTPLVSWRWWDGHGAVQQGLDPLEALPAHDRRVATYVWTPATDTVLTEVRAPARSRAKFVQALPYVLEEQLLSEPENLHFAAEPRNGGRYSVAVTARQPLRLWMERLHAVGFRPSALCPVTLAVACEPDGWCMVWDQDEVWLRTGEYEGLACLGTLTQSLDMVQAALDEARRAEKAPSHLTLVQPPPGLDAAALAERLALPVRVSTVDALSIISPSAPAMNLCQGEFVGDSGKWRESARALRPAGILLVVWLLASFVADAVEWGLLRHEHSAMRSEMLTLFRTTFPDARAIVDPALQMQRNHASLSAGRGARGVDEFLAGLHRVAQVITGDSTAALKSLRFTGDSLALTLKVADREHLETLRRAFDQHGFQAEILGTDIEQGRVRGRLRLKLSERS